MTTATLFPAAFFFNEHAQAQLNQELGEVEGLSVLPDWSSVGEEGSYFSLAVASAGDVNDDSYADVVVGAYNMNTVYVFHGSATGLSTTPDWSAIGETASDQFAGT